MQIKKISSASSCGNIGSLGVTIARHEEVREFMLQIHISLISLSLHLHAMLLGGDGSTHRRWYNETRHVEG